MPDDLNETLDMRKRVRLSTALVEAVSVNLCIVIAIAYQVLATNESEVCAFRTCCSKPLQVYGFLFAASIGTSLSTSAAAFMSRQTRCL